jgi:hypothetical protein
MRSKVEPMKEVAQMIRRHFDGIVAWTQTRQTNGFLEALNRLFQAAKRKARGPRPLPHHAHRDLALSPESSTSPASTPMPANPLEIQENLKCSFEHPSRSAHWAASIVTGSPGGGSSGTPGDEGGGSVSMARVARLFIPTGWDGTRHAICALQEGHVGTRTSLVSVRQRQSAPGSAG